MHRHTDRSENTRPTRLELNRRPAACRPGTPSPMEPPAGYRLVEEPMHRIGIRDVVFVGGVHSGWRPARRAGEAGSLRRESAAVAVAALLS